ncbi:srs2 [[Candida] subhashii]|uniref:DNA 3'-5' helicase n=1 Tax=[Candida] subhashii TaxID=561895 RepID=A0A8J5UWM7_9ASCO|nr:srs2 [[Candida] subhashii]KAG7663080.1 srs2 [[Candida] subhashii]
MSPSANKVPTEVILRRFLSGLNENQLKAVTAPPHGRLQIIAGPGTGKTKVLTSRVAYLLIRENIPPEQIIVTTFTKKAANEMTERLEKMLVDTPINLNKLLIGTFHSICYRIIKRYGKKLGISSYRIADERDKDHFLKEVFKGLTDEELAHIRTFDKWMVEVLQTKKGGNKYNFFDSGTIGRQISKFKSSGILPNEVPKTPSRNDCLVYLYEKYQAKLAENRALDFDDCLLYCYKLISQYPVLNYIEHILVDEFQDTNPIQLQLMYYFAQGHPTIPETQNNVTIVGDPDQSIYGFREAQSINFKKMIEHYESRSQPCTIISLNENYRSTKDILDFSESVMRQQHDRTTKSLNSQLTNSFKPVYAELKGSDKEARWIVYQIKHLLELPNSPIEYKDISILVRAAWQTRVIEEEFVKARLPYHMIRGKAFWERQEVIGIMDYLRVIGDEYDRVSVLRTLNYPKRGLGPKAMAQIEGFLETYHGTTHDALRELAAGKGKDVKLGPKLKKSIGDYVELIQDAREICSTIDQLIESEKPEESLPIVRQLFDLVYENSTLKKHLETEDGKEGKHGNVLEVKRMFEEFIPIKEPLPAYIGSTESDLDTESRNYILQFIESVGLYDTSDNTTTDQEESSSSRGRIALSTIHGSKGLEWPVVFVPGLSEGILPSSFARGEEEPKNEERRCFYVATTRAKSLLYISSYFENSESDWRPSICCVSQFIETLIDGFAKHQEAFSKWDKFEALYKILGKEGLLPGNKDDFPLASFNRCYKSHEKRFIRGKDPVDFKEYLNPPEKKKQSKKNENADTDDEEVEIIAGFTSAAEIIQAGNGKKRKYNNAFGKAPLPSSATITGAAAIKTPTINKAPPYIPNGKISVNSKSIVHNGTKRAPIYIPDR